MTADTKRQPIRGIIDGANWHTSSGAVFRVDVEIEAGWDTSPVDERVVIVPEELWDQMLPPVPVPPVFPLSDIDLRMWAVEQAITAGPEFLREPIPVAADRLIAYVQGTLK